MFLFILTTISLIFFLPLNLSKNLSFSSKTLCKTIKKTILTTFPGLLTMKKDLVSTSKVENVVQSVAMTVLDLPELALDCILEKLAPTGLRNMRGVCRSLRDRCVCDHLWEGHLGRKWGRVLGPAAYREWKWFVASKGTVLSSSSRKKSQGFYKFFDFFWPSSWFQLKFDHKVCRTPVVDSVMSLYFALDTGKFWFPAQVYNRENGHVGFMLSCYDAELSYDSQTDTFNARYPPHGIRAVAIENGVQWDRLRVPPVETSPHDLHFSDCLHDLHPGDHIEIQWRRNKEFPYGWWYGVIGHLETCDGNEIYCRCCDSDTIVLEFNQYTPGSRWRKTYVSRKDHREEGNENDGFYGGIRKLYKHDEIATWKRLWPRENLE